jgi:hypothetical protein
MYLSKHHIFNLHAKIGRGTGSNMEYIKDLYSPEIDHAICKNMLYLKMETHFVYDIIIIAYIWNVRLPITLGVKVNNQKWRNNVMQLKITKHVSRTIT